MFGRSLSLDKTVSLDLFLFCFYVSTLYKLYLSLFSLVLHIETLYHLIWSVSRIWESASESRHPDIKPKASCYCKTFKASLWIACQTELFVIHSQQASIMHDIRLACNIVFEQSNDKKHIQFSRTLLPQYIRRSRDAFIYIMETIYCYDDIFILRRPLATCPIHRPTSIQTIGRERRLPN